MFPTRFTSLNDLARLPWFELRDGRLVVADESIPPAIDVHAHFALSFVLPPSVDLRRETPRTEHYLPSERPLDIEPYGNRNFTDADLRRMKLDLSIKSLGANGMRATVFIDSVTANPSLYEIPLTMLPAGFDRTRVSMISYVVDQNGLTAGAPQVGNIEVTINGIQ